MRRSPPCGCPQAGGCWTSVCGAGELLARLAARFELRTEGIEPAAEWAAAARPRVGVVHEARFADVTLEHGAYDLVACVASSHAIGSWDESLRALAGRARADGGHALVGVGFWRHEPSAVYLERLGGASADELPDGVDGLCAGARAAGWEVLRSAVASDADWAACEETLLANGECAGCPAIPTPTCARGSTRPGRAGRARAGRTRWASRC